MDYGYKERMLLEAFVYSMPIDDRKVNKYIEYIVNDICRKEHRIEILKNKGINTQVNEWEVELGKYALGLRADLPEFPKQK